LPPAAAAWRGAFALACVQQVKPADLNSATLMIADAGNFQPQPNKTGGK
jgi:hypothetical protein